jgi:hypothetical protein
MSNHVFTALHILIYSDLDICGSTDFLKLNYLNAVFLSLNCDVVYVKIQYLSFRLKKIELDD